MRPMIVIIAASIALAACAANGSGQQTHPWPTPAQIFAGLGDPVIHDDRSRLLASPDIRVVVHAYPDEIIIVVNGDVSDLDTDAQVAALVGVVSFLKRAVDNSLPFWPGAGASVCSGMAAVQGADTLNLYNADRHIFIRRKGRQCHINITPYVQPPSAE